VLHHVRGILIDKVGHKFVIDDLPGPHVARAGDQHDQDADGEPCRSAR
jgi:hypothetical protein